MNADKIFVINLDDKIHRYEKFYDLGLNIERFSAVDSRENFKVCEQYDLKLNPVGVSDKLYFSQTTGAVGAFCSHYLLWLEILNKGYKDALIFEDDAYTEDIKNLLKSKLEIPSNCDFLQLNKRWHHKKNYYMNFDGLESYYLTNSCAKKLIENVKNREHWNNKVKTTPFEGMFSRSKLAKSDIFKEENNSNQWSEKKSIVCAVDKFVGYCATPSLDKNRITIHFNKKINVFEQKEKSDIELRGIKSWHTSTEYELRKFMKSSYYEFWNKGLFLST